MLDASKTKLAPWGSKSAYSDVEMSDASVARFASLGLTLREIAALFCVEENTLLKHHHEAFNAGKSMMKSAPRIILFNNIRSLQEQLLKNLAEVGEFAYDNEGNEIRVQIDHKLAKLVLEYLAQADK